MDVGKFEEQARLYRPYIDDPDWIVVTGPKKGVIMLHVQWGYAFRRRGE